MKRQILICAGLHLRCHSDCDSFTLAGIALIAISCGLLSHAVFGSVEKANAVPAINVTSAAAIYGLADLSS
jgi:hypothetical protein